MFALRSVFLFASLIVLWSSAAFSADTETSGRWTAEKALAWQRELPWLVGANYSPAYAINQLEMWQADTFDPAAIDRELGWAEDLGFTSLRVFLHHLLWEQDSAGLLQRIDRFLTVAEKHKIGVMFVLFDSVWDPHPVLGKQRAPQPGLHNSGWVQSPGANDLLDASRQGLLEAYVKGVIGKFKADRRVQVWDLWNEPDNLNDNSYGHKGLKREPPGKQQRVFELLKQEFGWVRAAGPTQPLTSGLWIRGRMLDKSKLIPIERLQLQESDVISFHSYDKIAEMKQCIAALRSEGRPLLCTEYMARGAGSTFDPVLDALKAEGVGAYCWGFVAGKTNTIYPWDSWNKPYSAEPAVWFHDIFRPDGTPFDQREVQHIKQLTHGPKR